jgi:hypothetical protein
LSVTAETGSPIEATGMLVPSRSAVHKVCVIAIGIVDRASTPSAAVLSVAPYPTSADATPTHSNPPTHLKLCVTVMARSLVVEPDEFKGPFPHPALR